MSWGTVQIGTVCEIVSGATPRTSKPEYWNGDVKWVTPKDLSNLREKHISDTPRKITKQGLNSCAAKMLPPQSVLLSCRAPIGLVAINTEPVCTNQGFKSLVPKANQVDPNYLYWWLLANREYLDGLGRGATFKEISKSIIEEIEIPLPQKNGNPDLDEQKRIAAILDKADAIRRKLQQSLRLSDDFLRSVFLDMFGDPVTNPKGWPVEPLSEGIESFEGGKNVNPCDTPRRDGVRVLKVSAVTSGEYLEAESKSFGEDFQVPSNYIVKTGDLLISRANTAELVGAVAYVWNTSGRAMLPDKLWRFVWSKPAKINPLFMLHMARSEHFRKQLILRATGSSGSMKNIGKVKMLEIPIPLPPIALQNKFATIVNKTQGKIQKSSAFLQEAESLFSTLQQRAFRGEL